MPPQARFRPALPGWRAICGAALFLFAASGHAGAQEFYTLKGHGGPIKGIAAAGDGTILTASFDNTVGLWRNGAPTWLDGHDAAVNAVVYLGDGRVVSAGDDYSIRLWDSAAGTSRLLGRHAAKILQLAVSPDGKYVASASWDRTARVWPLKGDAPPVEMRGHGNIVNDVVFSGDGTQLITASGDGTLRVWNTATGAVERLLVEHGFGINAIELAPDDNWIAYGAVDGGTRVLSLPDGEVLGDFTLGHRPILALAQHAGTARIAVGDGQGYIMMVDTENWRVADDFQASTSGPVWALAFSPDGQNIHAGGLDNAMYSWPVNNMVKANQMAAGQRSYQTPPEEMSNGERQFQRKCSICHTLGPDSERRAGPTLYQVFGRPAGTIDGYSYSDTLKTSDIIWSETTIDLLFDHGPDDYIPGSKMPLQRITSAADRADLIAFLKTSTTPE
ncbi:cytochrome C [Sulfitobacter sp. JL08]|nr:cytochrome C [Sulfitobacter sp. JL08]